MHACTGVGIAGSDCTGMCVEAWIERQQGRMNVQDTPLPASDELRCKNSHESCQDYPVGIRLYEALMQRVVKILSTGEVRVINHRRSQAEIPGSGKSWCLWPVADDQFYAGIEFSEPAGLGNGKHVGATPGNQNCKP